MSSANVKFFFHFFRHKMVYDPYTKRIQMLDEVEVSSSEDEESVGGDVPASDSEGE